MMKKIKEILKKLRGGRRMRNWSLKKKLAVGAAAIGTAILSVFAYGKYNQEVLHNEEDFENEDFEEAEEGFDNFKDESETE